MDSADSASCLGDIDAYVYIRLVNPGWCRRSTGVDLLGKRTFRQLSSLLVPPFSHCSLGLFIENARGRALEMNLVCSPGIGCQVDQSALVYHADAPPLP